MVGIANEDFYAGDDCYIVLQKPDGSKEVLEGRFLETLSETHPAWQELRNRGFSEYARPVRAIVTSVPMSKRDSIDSIAAGQEPFRPYTVISTKDYIDSLEKQLCAARSETTAVQERLTSKLMERDIDLSLARHGFENEVTKYATESAAHVTALQSQVQTLRKSSTKMLWVHVAIGVALGVGTSFGGMAAYKNYQAAKAQTGETAASNK